MNIVQCQFCKKPFIRVGGRICPDCLEQLDKDFITVRDYIDENQRANIKKISDDTEVPEQHIMYLIKEGRLIIDSPAGDGGGLIFCEVCKKPIKTGRMCDACKTKISSTIDKSASGGSQSSGRRSSAPDGMSPLGKIRK